MIGATQMQPQRTFRRHPEREPRLRALTSRISFAGRIEAAVFLSLFAKVAKMQAKQSISHVLFDMDGLLLDTEIVYTRATQQIVGRFGKVFDWSVKSNMIGRPAVDSAQYLIDTLALPISVEDYLAEREGLMRAGFSSCDPLPGAKKLVSHLSAHAIPIAVATSSNRDLFEVKTQNHAWFALFDAIVTGDEPDVKRGKPAPDIFLSAAQRIGAPPETTLVFEDAPS